MSRRNGGDLGGVTVGPGVRRAVVVVAAGAAALVSAAGPALAHVEVDAAPARALATHALLTMTAEAESDDAGITGVRIQLPSGLVPADLTLASGPAGWKLTGSAAVVDVQGPALPVGRSLRLGLRVRQLPAGSRLVLKTIQSYSDGRRDAWIEVPSASVPDPDQPAPVVRLQAAAPGTTPLPRATTPATAAPTATAAAPSTAAPTAAPSTAAPAASAPAVAEPDDDTGNGAAWLLGGVLIGVVLLGGIVFAASRKAANAER